MKFFVTTLVVLALCSGATAADAPILNDASITMFINVFPQYKKIAEKYGETVHDSNVIPSNLKFKAEIDQLLAKHGSDIEHFSLIMQKIATGITVIKLKESNMPDLLPSLQKLSTASEGELDILKKNLKKIEELFELE